VLSLTGLTGKICWSNNWVTFMDSMLQTLIVMDETRSLCVPTEIQKLTVNVRQHIIYLHSLDVNDEQGEFQMSTFVHFA